MNSIPLGLLFSLSQNNKAMNYYSSLTDNQRNNISSYIQNCKSSNEAKEKISNVINRLENRDISFLNNGGSI